MKLQDRLTIYNEDGNRLVTTYDNTSIQHRIMKALGIGCFADDLIVNAGLADMADMIMDRYDYISLGTGDTAPTATDTALESECITRQQCSSKVLATTYYTNDTARFTASFTPDSNLSVTESGLHLMPTATNDIMFARETFTARSLLADITYPIIWDIIVMR